MLETILHPLVEFVTRTIGAYGVPAVVVVQDDESGTREVVALSAHPLAGGVDGRLDVTVVEHHGGEWPVAFGHVQYA